ncbi:MAG: hypothetical protein JXA64_08270 [Candidatus Fermentibacteraceae bacterium]|nr:hypothetical protein [Candidatus Fermentibacteraceae bacterium]MBN2609095.1 hypothetical protein [Candidatus Fermentibacteraceae bacterium]
MKMNRYLRAVLIAVMLLLPGCGGGGDDYDRSGYMTGDTDEALFTRGCQEYLRGSLTGSRETFNSLIYRFPDSPLRGDAQLAVRKIEADLTGQVVEPVEVNGGSRVSFPSVAIVGTPSVFSTVTQLEALVSSTGSQPITIEDPGAPDVTLVLYPEGYLEQANQVSDSLSGWLSSHSSVPVQPGGDIISTVAPQHVGVVIVIGSDASVNPFVIREHSVEP